MEAALRTLGVTRVEQLWALNQTGLRTLCQELSNLNFSYGNEAGTEEGERQRLP
jgi:hypothetical protein|eukprot:COSAG01_NODE_4815_length_4725_cov_2.012970_7_plen_54_part_00